MLGVVKQVNDRCLLEPEVNALIRWQSWQREEENPSHKDAALQELQEKDILFIQISDLDPTLRLFARSCRCKRCSLASHLVITPEL